jgi:hypothetical protein
MPLCPEYCRAVSKNSLKWIKHELLSKFSGCPPLKGVFTVPVCFILLLKRVSAETDTHDCAVSCTNSWSIPDVVAYNSYSR